MINKHVFEFLLVAADKPTSGRLWGHDVIKLKLAIKIGILCLCLTLVHVLLCLHDYVMELRNTLLRSLKNKIYEKCIIWPHYLFTPISVVFWFPLFLTIGIKASVLQHQFNN